MATNLENLQTAYANVCARLADVTGSPKPDYSIDGKTVSWGTYFTQLTQQADALRTQIAKASGPTAIRSRAVT